MLFNESNVRVNKNCKCDASDKRGDSDV